MSKLQKANWKEEHLAKRHQTNFDWCPLCIARLEGEEHPPQHLTPPQQDPTQEGMAYLDVHDKIEERHKNVIEKSGEVDEVIEKYDATKEKQKREDKKKLR